MHGMHGICKLKVDFGLFGAVLGCFGRWDEQSFSATGLTKLNATSLLEIPLVLSLVRVDIDLPRLHAARH